MRTLAIIQATYNRRSADVLITRTALLTTPDRVGGGSGMATPNPTVSTKKAASYEISAAFGFWFAGLCDGEGSFNISRHRTGLFCSFHVGLRLDDLGTLEIVLRELGFGRIFVEKARPTPGRNSRGAARWVAQSSSDCLALVEIFEHFPLRSKKRGDFLIWSEAVRLFAGTQTRGSRHYTMPEKKSRDAQLSALKTRLEQGRKFPRP